MVAAGRVVAVIVVVAAAFAASGCRSESPEPLPPATPMVEPGAGQGTPEATPFILTAEQRQRVVEIAANDSHQLVQDEPLTVSDVIPWSDGTGEFIGGVATVAFGEPRTVEGVWLGVVFSADEVTYDSMPYRARLSNVTSLTVWVDLRRAEVVGLEPDHEARPEGTPEILATPNVTPRAGD